MKGGVRYRYLTSKPPQDPKGLLSLSVHCVFPVSPPFAMKRKLRIKSPQPQNIDDDTSNTHNNHTASIIPSRIIHSRILTDSYGIPLAYTYTNQL